MSEGSQAGGAPAATKGCLKCGLSYRACFDRSRDVRSRCLIGQGAAFHS